MSTGSRWKRFVGMLFLCVSILCAVSLALSNAQSAHTQRKAKKAPPPPLPNGSTGPVQQIPLDSIAPVPPQVTYQNEQLTIVAPNSTLADILRAVRKQTGAEIEIPAAPERVVTHLGPGAAREVLAELLNGSRFNYVLLGSADNEAALTRVVLVAKTAPESGGSSNQVAEQTQPGMVQAGNLAPPQTGVEANDADTTEETTDDAADQAAAEAEQPVATPDQPGIKTPQQLLQEMQQRQLLYQQQQNGGQAPPVPGMPAPQPQPQ